MKTLLTFSLSLSVIIGYSQIFEYVFTEIGHAEFSEVVVVGDKILVAANLSECPGAGIAVFDDSGQLLSETILEDYYSEAPSITYHKQSGFSYLLTFRNESEERYDVDQMIIYKIDQNGNVLDSHRDTIVASHFLTGKIVALDSVLIVQRKNAVYWYSLSFEALDTLYLPDENREYEMIYADEDRLMFTSMVRNGETDYEYLIDQLIDYRIPLDSLNITGLSSFKRFVSLSGSNLFFYGVDNSLQKYLYGLDSIQESIVLPPNVIDIKVMQHEGRTFAILRLNTDEMQLVEIDFVMGVIYEPTWSITSRELLHSVVQFPDRFYLISKLVITDGVYYPMNYSVLRKLQYGFNEVIEREDILIEEINVLQTYERVESNVYPEGLYDQRVPAIVAIRVKNQSDRLIENFGYFSESIGGSFCSSGRNMKYLEASMAPGAAFQFYDTIYPYGGPAAEEFDQNFSVAAPNHKLDTDTTHNTVNSILFTTSTNDIHYRKVKIFPNPSSHRIYIEGLEFDTDLVRIYSFNGQLLLQSNDWKDGIEITQLPQGIYHILTISEKNPFRAVFIKN